jgi:hypothetical protein
MTTPNIKTVYFDKDGRPTLEFMKLLQQQAAEIAALEARITALEP